MVEIVTLRQWESELVTEYQRVGRQLSLVRALIAEATQQLSTSQIAKPKTAKPTELVQTRRKRNIGQEGADVVYPYLKQLGREETYENLYQVAISHGLTFGGKDPRRNFSANVLSRDKRFVPGSRRGTWGLREWVTGEDGSPAPPSQTEEESQAHQPEGANTLA